MTEAENPRAVIGGNAPPDADALMVEAQERIDTANRWITERGDLDKWTAEIADKINAFIGQIDATYKALDGRRLDENRAFKAQQDAKYNNPLSLLERAKKALAPLRSGWLQRQEDKLRREREAKEAEAKRAAEAAAEVVRKAQEQMKVGGDPLRAQQQAEEAQRKAEEAARVAAEVPEKAQIKGNYSTTARGLTTRWSAEITDINLATKHYLAKKHPSRPILVAAIEASILSIAKKEAIALKDETKAPPGIKFTSKRE